MSRTIRKRLESYPVWKGIMRWYVWDHEAKMIMDAPQYNYPYREIGIWESYEKDEILYYTDKKHGFYFWKKHKTYRKQVNRTRRNHDKRELRKEINCPDYEGLYSAWNAKDSDPDRYR